MPNILGMDIQDIVGRPRLKSFLVYLNGVA